MMDHIIVPEDYDYVGVYLTDKCFLKCPYCITSHHGSSFIGRRETHYLSPQDWIRGLNRLVLPKEVPISLQGGEPFLYKGIWEILENIKHKVDIMTALPPHLTREHFLKLKTLAWNQRACPYPTIRVSYHQGQNDFRELVARIATLNDILSIGLYYLTHPSVSEAEICDMKAYAKEHGVEFRAKDFLGSYDGKMYGALKYPGSVAGTKQGVTVYCRNTVVPVAPDGMIYLCHSDLYFNRRERALGNILDGHFAFPAEHIACSNFGLCSECDVKIKNNHYQQFGYTSVDIKFQGAE
ncbi:MAG: radical SAM protein [Candidatus Omnitrophica bacterium]|nr:radical SAM protein [Candidatus Omnitrophota bacterium]